MGAVDEAAKINRPTVEVGWREKIDAVVSPAKSAREFRYGMISRQVIPSWAKASNSREAASQQLARREAPCQDRSSGTNPTT